MLIVKIVLFLASAVLLALAYFRNRKKLNTEARLSFIAGVICFALPVILDHCLPESESPDYVALHKPYIEASLVIDAIGRSGIRYHYDVRNLGQLSAEGLVFIHRGPRGSGIDNSVQRRDLCPQGKMTLRPIVIPEDELPTNAYIRLKLTICYEATIQQARIPFSSYFYFDIPDRDVRVGDFAPSTATWNEGGMDRETQMKLIGFPDVLDSESGSHFFWFDLWSTVPSNQPSHFFKTKTKSLILDPANNMVIFDHTPESSRRYILAKELYEASNQWHHIAVSWCPTGSLLGVDGRCVQFFGDPPREPEPRKIVEPTSGGESSPRADAGLGSPQK